MKLLNVGGGNTRELPERFKGWEHIILDVDPEVKPDILLDARDMGELPPNEYDVVICSHNMEHYYKHEVEGVLKGILHVLKDDGYAEITVPNLEKLFEAIHKNSFDINDIWYRTQQGTPISFHDVLYGWNYAMEKGNLYYAHHCGWTKNLLCETLIVAGFKGGVQVWEDDFNIYTRSFKKEKQPCQ